jgi:hypothetical protein
MNLHTAEETTPKIKQKDHVEAEKRVNPYKDYPLSVCALLRAILCEIWELRQDISAK